MRFVLQEDALAASGIVMSSAGLCAVPSTGKEVVPVASTTRTPKGKAPTLWQNYL